MPLPSITPIQTDAPAPLEGQDVPTGTGVVANIRGTFAGNLGTSLIAHTYSGGQQVPYDEAAKSLKDEGLDPSVLPKDGISEGYLNAVRNQQLEIQRDRDLTNRAHLGSVATFGSSLIGGAGDPIFLGIGAVTGGLGLGARGAALGARVAEGAAEGAGTLGAYDLGKKYTGTAQGDPDITSATVLHDMAWGGAFGGLVKGAFGARPEAVPEKLQVLDQHKTFLQDAIPGITITSGLRSVQHNAAIGGAMHSMHLSGEAVDFVLPKGMTADAAKAAIQAKGLPITEWLIEKKGDLHSTGDHIHWGWGEKGRPQFGLAQPETQQAVAHTAVTQAMEDSPIVVKPLIDQADEEQGFRTNPMRIADEHDAEVSRLETEGMQAAIPKPGSIFAADADNAAVLQKADAANNAPIPRTESGEGNPELADLKKATADAVSEAEQAHELVVSPGKLRTALKLPSGEIRIGQPGQIHAELFKKGELEYGEAYGKATGFATPQGEFLDRDQARAWVEKNQPGVAETMDEVIKEKGDRGKAKNEVIAEAYRYAMERHEEESPLKAAMAAEDEAAHNDDDMVKAVQAAVRCSMSKGLD